MNILAQQKKALKELLKNKQNQTIKKGKKKKKLPLYNYHKEYGLDLFLKKSFH